jgi:hypothetical protein
LQVVDAPRFVWRGVLLDAGRHFFSVPFILRVLDLMALHKLNRFHWHLCEDQVRHDGGKACNEWLAWWSRAARCLVLSE